MIKRRHSVLPPTMAPIGLDREEAAAAVAIGVTLFDQMVQEGDYPQPYMSKGRLVWSRSELEAAFHRLPKRAPDGKQTGNSWAGVE